MPSNNNKTRRYTDLYARIIQLFPKDKATLLVPKAPPHCAPTVHIFVDLSNVYISFCSALAAHLRYYRAADASRHVHDLDLAALACVLQRGRSAAHRVVVGSLPRSPASPMHRVYERMFAQARALGYDVTVMSRVQESDDPASSAIATYKEHGVDELLSFGILETLASAPTRGILVLATGDGQPSAHTNGGSIGFFRAVERALAAGWAVELYSFGRALSSNWRRLAQASTALRIVYLDEFVLDLAPGPAAAALKTHISGAQRADPAAGYSSTLPQ